MTSNPKTPAILGGCGCLSLLLAVAMLSAAMFFADGNVQLPGRSGPEMARYTNTKEGRTGNLAENYVDFTFEYPKTWSLKADADDSNFVSVSRVVEEKTWEAMNVGYFQTAGSQAGNEMLYSQLIASLQGQFANQMQGLRKVSEGKRTIGTYDAYEGLFESSVMSDGKPVRIYTRAILLPTKDAKKGVTLLLMGTSAHPDLKGPEDLGVKGELPAVLETFRFSE
jgi:hypothetical protein